MYRPSSFIWETLFTILAKHRYYYDQFYEPFRNYPAPIVAIPGNHDGVVYAKDPAPTLDAFLQNFCAASPAPSPDAGTLVRTTMIAAWAFTSRSMPHSCASWDSTAMCWKIQA